MRPSDEIVTSTKHRHATGANWSSGSGSRIDISDPSAHSQRNLEIGFRRRPAVENRVRYSSARRCGWPTCPCQTSLQNPPVSDSPYFVIAANQATSRKKDTEHPDRETGARKSRPIASVLTIGQDDRDFAPGWYDCPRRWHKTRPPAPEMLITATSSPLVSTGQHEQAVAASNVKRLVNHSVPAEDGVGDQGEAFAFEVLVVACSTVGESAVRNLEPREPAHAKDRRSTAYLMMSSSSCSRSSANLGSIGGGRSSGRREVPEPR